jgi:AcrR family transcriptional regulator
MPKVTEEHVAARRRQILEAAMRCFAREGFHRTTMQDIFGESGLSAGAVYSYFPGKAELVRALAAQVVEGARQVLREGETLEGVFNRLSGFFEELEVGPSETITRTAVQFWAEALRNPELHSLLLELIAFEREHVGRLAREAQARGEIDPALDPDAVARTLLGLFHGMLLQRALYPELDLDAYRACARALLTGSFRTR